MSVYKKQLEAGLMLAQMSKFKKKETKLILDFERMLKVAPRSYVSCSWGKQSIILAHIVYRLSLSTPIVFFDGADCEIIANFYETESNFLNRFPIKYVRVPNSDLDLMGNGKKFMSENNLSGVFMGLSAIESRGRKYSMKNADRNNILRYADGTFRCCPLAWWNINDFASYIAKYSLPMLSTYQKFGLEARTAAGVTPGSHAECGIDVLSTTKQNEIKDRWRKRCSLKSYSISTDLD